ncbi:unannotated protein [freshwater metagenome]|uniref:Unannotated protein n=1 Tax=freshwater metagenome TaxID=449393 RepID=A0A6J6K211_9ZZZZ
MIDVHVRVGSVTLCHECAKPLQGTLFLVEGLSPQGQEPFLAEAFAPHAKEILDTKPHGVVALREARAPSAVAVKFLVVRVSLKIEEHIRGAGGRDVVKDFRRENLPRRRPLGVGERGVLEGGLQVQLGHGVWADPRCSAEDLLP